MQLFPGLFRSMAALVLLGASGMAMAQSSTRVSVASNTSLYAGPGVEYPQVDFLRRGERVRLYGCLADYAWCDIGPEYGQGYNTWRGWVRAQDLHVWQNQRTYFLHQAYTDLPWFSYPLITFSFDNYWYNHYRQRQWYNNRSQWSRWDWQHHNRQHQWPRHNDPRYNHRNDNRYDRGDNRYGQQPDDRRGDGRYDQRRQEQDYRNDRREDSREWRNDRNRGQTPAVGEPGNLGQPGRVEPGNTGRPGREFRGDGRQTGGEPGQTVRPQPERSMPRPDVRPEPVMRDPGQSQPAPGPSPQRPERSGRGEPTRAAAEVQQER